MNIVVYCSAQDNLDNKYLKLATVLGQWIGKNGHTLIYGGADQGLMHATAQAVHEAGGRIVGVLPAVFSHLSEPLCDEMVATRDLQERKQYMIEHGDVFVVLPGGIGTLDEWISTICIMCIGNDDHRPIIVADLDGMFDSMVAQLDVLYHSPFGRGKDLNRSIVARTPDELLTILSALKNN